MRSRALALWESIRTSFWFLPAIMSVGSIFLVALTARLGNWIPTEAIEAIPLVYAGDAAGARAILTTIAGSMVGITGVTFSVTIVALSLASTQLGPRLLRNFMSDTGNQVVLGTFISTFLFCLLALREVQGEDARVPVLLVTTGILLALASLAVLIYFFHHVAVSIQAPHVVAWIARDLGGSIAKLEPIDEADTDGDGGRSHGGLAGRGTPVVARRAGYVQGLDLGSICRRARSVDASAHVLTRPGQFVVLGDTLATIHGTVDEERIETLAQTIRSACVIGSQRTATEDLEFGVHQLVEIALRALSPGVNDPHTAINCIDWLGAALSDAVTRQLPPERHYDPENTLRVLTRTITYRGLLDAAFLQIRQACVGNTAVAIRMLEALASIADRVQQDDTREHVRTHIRLVWEANREAVAAAEDRTDLEERYRLALGNL